MRGQSALDVHTTHGHQAGRDQRTRHGEVADASLDLEWREGFCPNHSHGSNYELQHLTLEEVAGRRGLTSEADGAVVTDGVEVEMTVKSGKLLLAQLLSCTQVSQTLGKA
jgi:hypothetical protein